MRLKSIRNNKTEKLDFRCTKEEKNNIKRKAAIYAEGNLSEYVLYAALNFVPDKNDLVEEKKPPTKKSRGKK